MGIFSSGGAHGGGHKDRQRGQNASQRKDAARAQNAKLAKQRGSKGTDGRKGKPSGKKAKGGGPDKDDLNTL